MDNYVLMRSLPPRKPGICLWLNELEAARLLGLLRQQTISLHPVMQVRSPWNQLAERIVQATVMAE